MNFLTPIIKDEQRVLSTQQLAEAYEVSDKKIRDNFTNNKSHYTEGKHYFKIEGDELKEFKASHDDTENFGAVGSRASSVYLWTELGALHHAKSLGTEKAWEVYERLEETYFKVQAVVQNKTPQIDSRFLFQIAQQLEEKERQIALMQPKVEFFDAVAESKDAIDIGSAAKVLNMGIGRNKLFEMLRNEKVLMDNNQPYQKFIDQGYFRTVEQKFNKPDGSTNINIKTLVYQKGLNFIRKTLS